MSGQFAHWPAVSRLKTRHLRLLLQLDAHRSVLRASQACGMTQPQASKSLGEMEALLGVRLFERLARGVEPTLYGAALVRRARVALAEIDRACDEIEALRDGRLGHVAVGALINPGIHLVPEAIARLKRECPQLQVSVEIDYSLPLVDRLLAGQFDLVVGRVIAPYSSASGLLFEPLAGEPHALVVRAGHALAGRERIEPGELDGYGWILPPADSVLRARLDAAFVKLGLPAPREVVHTASLPVVTSLLCRSDMLAVLPPDAVALFRESGLLTVLPIELEVALEPFCIVRHGERALSPAADRLLREIRAVAASLYGRGAAG